MQTYQGTKTVLAVAMCLSAFNELMQRPMPEAEEEGYLVEYTDGGKPNHPDHVGYISWSPKDVFERSYKPASTVKERAQLEHDELQARVAKLEDFIANSLEFRGLPEVQKNFLRPQLSHMRHYLSLLAGRLAAWEA